MQQMAVGHEEINQYSKATMVGFEWQFGLHLNLKQGNKVFIFIHPKKLLNQLFVLFGNIAVVENAGLLRNRLDEVFFADCLTCPQPAYQLRVRKSGCKVN